MMSFYQNYIGNVTKNDGRTRASVDATIDRVNRLLAEQPANARRVSGLVVGRVQSGKTRNYVGLTLKAVEEGWNVIIVLTSANTALAEQTQGRLAKDYKRSGVGDHNSRKLNFLEPVENDEPTALEVGDGSFFYWGVAMKEKASLQRIHVWLEQWRQHCPKMRVLVIDDEADNATPDSNTNKGIPLDEDQVSDAIDAIRGCEENDFNALADWFDNLRTAEMPDEAAKTDEAKAFTRLLSVVAKAKMQTIFEDAEFRALLGIDPPTEPGEWREEISSLAEGYFNGKGERSHTRFAKILQSILGVASGRSAINHAVCKLVDRIGDVPDYTYPFEKCAYVGYTATPYACILNERPDQTPLYADFIVSLEKSPRYFGLDAIYGRDVANAKARMNIVRPITDTERTEILFPIEGVRVKEKGKNKPVLHRVKVNDDLSYLFDGRKPGEWLTLKNAIAWAFCTAAVRRLRYQTVVKPKILSDQSLSPQQRMDKLAETEDRWTTMLMNISQKQGVHKDTRDKLEKYLLHRVTIPGGADAFVAECKALWDSETKAFTHADFKGLFPEQGDDSVRYGKIEDYPAWEKIECHLRHFMKMASATSLANTHVIVINCNNRTEQDFYNQNFKLKQGSKKPRKLDDDHLWFICGGNTISRGLTLTGLTASYFDRIRRSVAVDTMTQMGRWFGYRENYELLPRIWMTPDSVTEMKRVAVVEDNMHAGIVENFKNGYSPSDESHYQAIYTFGRRLSGRTHAIRNLSVGVGTYGSTDDISVRPEDVRAVRRRAESFLKELEDHYRPGGSLADERKDKKLYPYGDIPLWTDVPKSEIVSFLQDVKASYPEKSRRILEGLLGEINRCDSTAWDVVVGEPSTGKNEKIRIAGRAFRPGTQKNAYVSNGSACFSAARLHMPYYAMIPASAINEIDFWVLRKELASKIIPEIENIAAVKGKTLAGIEKDLAPYPGETYEKRFSGLLERLDAEPYAEPVPSSIHGLFHGKLEGYRNRSSSEYMGRVHAAAAHVKPTLQFYFLTPPKDAKGVRDPLLALSFYWPGHEPDIFHAVSVGLEAKVPTVSRRRFFETVVEVLTEYAFPMEVGRLRQTVLHRLGVSCPESFFNRNLAKPPAGYDYVKMKKRNAYVLTSWANDCEKKLDEELLATAASILKRDGKPHTAEDLYLQVLSEQPKLQDLFTKSNSGDRARFAALVKRKDVLKGLGLRIEKSRPLTVRYRPFEVNQ